MWISLVLFVATGMETIFDGVGKLVKNEKVMSIVEIVIYVLITLSILWITYGVATTWMITSKNYIGD